MTGSKSYIVDQTGDLTWIFHEIVYEGPYKSDRNTGHSTDYPKPWPARIQSVFSEIWNSGVVRAIIPDMKNVNVNLSAVGLMGTGLSHEAHLVTSGPTAGLYNSWTRSERVGLFIDASLGVSASWYASTSARDINYNDYLGNGIEGSGKLIGGLSGSVSYDQFHTPTWLTLGASAGLSGGGYLGHSYTYPINGKKF
jgi:hypothetical protein